MQGDIMTNRTNNSGNRPARKSLSRPFLSTLALITLVVSGFSALSGPDHAVASQASLLAPGDNRSVTAQMFQSATPPAVMPGSSIVVTTTVQGVADDGQCS